MSSELKNPELMKFLSDYGTLNYSQIRFNEKIQMFQDEKPTNLQDSLREMVQCGQECIDRASTLIESANKVMAKNNTGNDVKEIISCLTDNTNKIVARIQKVMLGINRIILKIEPKETTNPLEQETEGKNLLETLRSKDQDMDVSDSEYDIVCAWVVPDDNDTDPDAILFRRMAAEIHVVSVNKDTICADLSTYVRNHMSTFYVFTQNAKYSMTGENEEEDVDIGLLTINGLVSGAFSEESYTEFIRLLDSEKVTTESTKDQNDKNENPIAEDTESAENPNEKPKDPIVEDTESAEETTESKKDGESE